MKIIVTHIAVDQDAVSSAWLVKRFMPGWTDAQLTFVSAGTTLEGMKPDADSNIVHVDTGLGKFDHHHLDDPKKQYCAAERVFDYLVRNDHIKQHDHEALSRMIIFITSIDHFGESDFLEPVSDIYDFELYQIIDSLHLINKSDSEICEIAFVCLDGLLALFRTKIKAEKEIKNGFLFECGWGKSLALESKNEEALKLALKSGFAVALRRDPDRGNIRIKAHPTTDIDLTPVYEEIIKNDKKATWFLHKSKKLLLNGSSHRPDSVPSTLTLKKVIEIIKSVA